MRKSEKNQNYTVYYTAQAKTVEQGCTRLRSSTRSTHMNNVRMYVHANMQRELQSKSARLDGLCHWRIAIGCHVPRLRLPMIEAVQISSKYHAPHLPPTMPVGALVLYVVTCTPCIDCPRRVGCMCQLCADVLLNTPLGGRVADLFRVRVRVWVRVRARFWGWGWGWG